MPDFRDEFHFGRPQRVFFGKVQVAFEESALAAKNQTETDALTTCFKNSNFEG